MPAAVDMTWQQTEQFLQTGQNNSRARRRKGAKPKKFEPFAVHEPEEPATDNSAWMAALDEIPPLEQTPAPKAVPKRRRNNQPPKPSAPKMYVPPHLRRQQSTPTAQSQSAQDGQAAASTEGINHTNGSPSSAEDVQAIKTKQTSVGASANGNAKTTPEHLRKRQSASEAHSKAALNDQATTPAQAGAIAHTTASHSPAEQTNHAANTPKNEYANTAFQKPKLQTKRQPQMNPPRKRTPWPKQSDMKPRSTDNNSEGGVTFKSNSNGDEEYDVKKLVDWEGNWLPPPEVWSARPGHAHRHFGREMELWMNKHAEECTRGIDIHTGRYLDEESNHESTASSTGCRELVPSYWALALANYKPAAEYWPEFVADTWAEANAEKWEREFPELFPYTNTEAPWWERYEQSDSFFLHALSVPDASIDREDPQNHIDKYGMESANARMEAMKQRTIQKHQRTMARRNRPIPAINTMLAPADDKRIVTKENFYLRPVQASDVQGILKIYNYYVRKTIHAPELYERTEEHIRDRINDVTEAKLPYLVAIKKGLNHNAYEADSSEQVLGFVNLDEEYSATSMSRFTFQMELFVHPAFQGKGIAKCLLDRVLQMSNSGWTAFGGYEYVNESSYLKHGPAQRIKTILLTVLHENGQDMADRTQYLSDFRFTRRGHVPSYGYKQGKEVDMTVYQHITAEIIDPYMN